MVLDSNKAYVGTVINIDDPACQARCKISIDGLTDNMPVNELPWATCGNFTVFSSNGLGGNLYVPKVGAKVRVHFKNGEFTNQEYFNIETPDKDMVNEVAADYKDSQCLIYDSTNDFKINLLPTTQGLTIYYKGSYIQILPNNEITINYGAGNSVIQLSDGKVSINAKNQIDIVSGDTVNISGKAVNILGSETTNIKSIQPGEPGVNGKALLTLLEQLALGIDTKMPIGSAYQAIVTAAKEGILNHTVEYV